MKIKARRRKQKGTGYWFNNDWHICFSPLLIISPNDAKRLPLVIEAQNILKRSMKVLWYITFYWSHKSSDDKGREVLR